MNDTADEVVGLSDEAGDNDDGTVSPPPAIVPKKRGRPSNAEKPKKAIVPTAGRGRGRPSKGTEGNNKMPSKTATSVDLSDDEGTESDEESPDFNGDTADGGTAVASKRGRKPKAKRKLANPIESTGKGRGRPKKVAKPDEVQEDDAADDDDEGASNDIKPAKKVAAKGAKKGRGRPKKVNNSDDESK